MRETMEAGVMNELSICREERDILKKKLHIHLDRWTLDKIMFEEFAAKAAREHLLNEAEHAYEISRRDVRLGSQQQQLLVLKLKLESAVEDTELRELQFSALKSQMQEERVRQQKWLISANKKLYEIKASVPVMVASERKKVIMETGRKLNHLQKLLDDKQQRQKVELEQMKEQHSLAVTQLKEENQLLVSRDDHWKVQQTRWNLEREELQAVLHERDQLKAGQEQWNQDQKQLQVLLQESNDLRAKQTQMDAVIDERERLLAQKDLSILREQEMQEVLKERDRLIVQQAHWVSQQEDMQELVKERDRLKLKLEERSSQDHKDLAKERDKLKHELELSISQREEEVKALVRERDFVWSQMKRMDEDYGDRVKKISGQMLQDRQETERLRREMQEAQMRNNEMMVEMTILKLEGKRVEDLAIQKQCTVEAELQELQSRLEKVKEENKTLVVEALKRDSSLLDSNSHQETLEKQLDSSDIGQDEGEAGAAPEEGREVLSAGEVLTLDQDILESQVEQATEADRSNDTKSLKSMEELQCENENLRCETENLRMLYAELEDALHKKNKKAVKLASKANHRDPTSRNLKLELEAAATCCPSDDNPVSDGKSQKITTLKRSSGSQKVATSTKSTQKKKKVDSSQAEPHGGASSKHREVSVRTTRSSKKRISRGKCPSGKDPTLDSALEQHDIEQPVQKRKRTTVDNGDLELAQRQRPPLHGLAHNQQNSAKSAVRLSLSRKGPWHDAEYKTLLGSPNKTSKMMANLFSTAFSVPKLKTGQTPVNFRT